MAAGRERMRRKEEIKQRTQGYRIRRKIRIVRNGRDVIGR